MGINKFFDINVSLTDNDFNDFDKLVGKAEKKAVNYAKKQKKKLAKEQKQILKIQKKDREKNNTPHLPGKGPNLADKTSSNPLAGLSKQKKGFDDIVNSSVKKQLKGEIQNYFSNYQGAVGDAIGLMSGGATGKILQFAQKYILPLTILLTVAESTKQIIQHMQQKGGWLDRYVRDSVDTLKNSLRDKHLTYSIKMGFSKIILVSDDTASPQVTYDSYKLYNENRDQLESDFKVREDSIF